MVALRKRMEIRADARQSSVEAYGGIRTAERVELLQSWPDCRQNPVRKEVPEEPEALEEAHNWIPAQLQLLE